MKTTLRFSLVLVAGALLTSASTRASEPKAADLRIPGLEGVGLEVQWTGQAVLNLQRDDLRHFSIDEDVVVVQASSGVVTVFDADSGRRRWSRQIGRTDEVSFPAASNSEIIVVVSGPVVYGFEKFAGGEIFRYRLPGQPSGRPLVDDLSFFLPMQDGAIYAFSIKTLQYHTRYGRFPANVARAFGWRFRCGELITRQPAMGSNVLAVISEKDNLHGVGLEGSTSGHSKFQLILNGSPTADVFASPRNDGTTDLIVPTTDRQVYNFRLPRGDMEWYFPMGHAVVQPPVGVNDELYIVNEVGELYSLDQNRGLPRQAKTETGMWKVTGQERVLAISDTAVYTEDLSHQLTAFDRITAEQKSRLSIRQFPHAIVNPLTDRIFLMTAGGEVFCLREIGSEFATFHQNPGRQPIVPTVPENEPAPVEDDG